MTTQQLFDRLWNDYVQHTPEAQAIHDLFVAEGETVVNDHIAYRTVDLPQVNLEVVAQAFQSVGYEEVETYDFPEKHLLAKHYEHPNEPKAPKVFISQFLLDEIAPEQKGFFAEQIAKIEEVDLEPTKLVVSGNLWGTPSFEKYNELREISEYLAWFYVFGFRANHFTVSVNELSTLNTLEKVNAFVKEKGYRMNTSGGEIKGSEEQLLKQSSTLAAMQDVQFEEGVHKLPTCFYEFAQRFPDTDGKLYRGFIAKSADKIFESTDFRM